MIEFNHFTFDYPETRSHQPILLRSKQLFQNLTLQIPGASRVLLVGANGVGKSTLLKIIDGLHWIQPQSLRVFGLSPFHDLELSQRISWVGGHLPLHLDITVAELLTPSFPQLASRDADYELSPREEKIFNLLGISKRWRMNHVSEGQRRRVQLFLGLKKACDLYLLDEVTSHLDVMMRADFLAWVQQESLRTGASVIFATHILDGLVSKDFQNTWFTHLLWLGFHGQYRLWTQKEVLRELKDKTTLSYFVESEIRKQ